MKYWFLGTTYKSVGHGSTKFYYLRYLESIILEN